MYVCTHKCVYSATKLLSLTKPTTTTHTLVIIIYYTAILTAIYIYIPIFCTYTYVPCVFAYKG